MHKTTISMKCKRVTDQQICGNTGYSRTNEINNMVIQIEKGPKYPQ